MKVHIEITDAQHRKLKTLKEKENRTMQYLVNKAIDNFLISKKVLDFSKKSSIINLCLTQPTK